MLITWVVGLTRSQHVRYLRCALSADTSPSRFFPILTTTFWVDQDFHLWMLFFVLPTTSLAVFLGCRKHKDKFVAGLSAAGLSCLFAVSLYESFFHVSQLAQHGSDCVYCVQGGVNGFFTTTALINVFGGVLLASAHVRNYRLCRKSHCSRDA